MTNIDKEKLLQWMREIQATYMKSYNDPATPEIVKADMGHMAGMILAMGLEIKSGRFDVDDNSSNSNKD